MEREPIKKQANQMVEDGDDDDNIMVENFDKPDDHEINIDEIAKPSDLSGGSPDFRRISVPQHRMTPLRNNWETIVKTIVDRLKLQVRMNTKKKCVEIKSAAETPDKMNIQRAADFIKAFVLGFNLSDAIAMLRLDDLYLETFEIRDVKPLHGEHLSRCIGRISGEQGKTKNAIENATRTRIVLADSKIHIMGSFGNIKQARAAISNLILGSPAGKIYSQLRFIAKKYKDTL